jgi:hypothetical protein
MKKNLEKVREWAYEKVRDGHEPPWAWYEYMKLIDASESILDGLDAARTGSSARSDRPPGKGRLQAVDAAYPRDGEPLLPRPKRRRLPM